MDGKLLAAKVDQPGFIRVQRQFELAHSLLEIVKQRSCLVTTLKAADDDDGVVCIANDDQRIIHDVSNRSLLWRLAIAQLACTFQLAPVLVSKCGNRNKLPLLGF
jgi:hypothetical protein